MDNNMSSRAYVYIKYGFYYSIQDYGGSKTKKNKLS